MLSNESTELCALPALVPYVSRAPPAHVPYVLSCLTCLVPYLFLCFMGLASYVVSCLALYEPFFLTYPVVSYLAYSFVLISIFVNLSFYALRPYFSVHLLIVIFWGEFIKVKTNTVCQ